MRQRVGTTDEGLNTRYFPAHEREELVKKLEESHEKVQNNILNSFVYNVFRTLYNNEICSKSWTKKRNWLRRKMHTK